MTYGNYENEAVAGFDINTDVATTPDTDATKMTDETAVEAVGDILAIKDGSSTSRPKDSHLTHDTAVLDSPDAMKARAVLKKAIIGSARRDESMIIMEKSHSWNFLLDALQEAYENDVLISLKGGTTNDLWKL